MLRTSHFHHTEPGQDGLASNCDFTVWESTRHEACSLQLGDSTFLPGKVLFQIRGQHHFNNMKSLGARSKGKGPKLKATVVTCPSDQAGETGHQKFMS